MSNTRVTYKQDIENGKLSVSYADVELELDPGDDLLQDAELTTHLAYLGLTTYLQREAAKLSGDKVEAIEEVYGQLCDERSNAFKRKPRKVSGPKKAEKVAALAAIKGVSPEVIREHLKKMDEARQAKVLDHPKVLAKVAEMSKAEDQIELDLDE